MRLIDADVLIERMYHDAFETDTDMQKWDSGCWIRYKLFENAIDAQPTIDAASVVHGEWIDVSDWWTPYQKCSICGAIVDGYGSNFCPNCGADMRGDSNE